MIINKDINPERELYYLGAKTIEILNKLPDEKIGLFDIFHLLNEHEKISMNLFTLSLDWLYILGAIKSDEGYIVKCF